METIICILFIAMATNIHQVTGQVRRLIVKGEIVIGGLVPIHDHDLEDQAHCGDLHERIGVQRLEAMLFAIDSINNNNSILQNVSLGLEVYDTCSSETVALDRALHFVQDREAIREHHTTNGSVMVGVIGPSFSSISVQVAHLYRLFQLPQVSFDSTSYELSDKTRFEFFSRTVPHDLYQAKALVDIAKVMNWTFVSVIYSDDSYGTLGYQAVKEEAKKAGICIAVAEKIEMSSSAGTFHFIIEKLLQEPEARSVVVFSSQERQIRNLLQAAKSKGASRAFQWLGTDAWGNMLWLKGLEDVAENTITVTPKTVELKAFSDYFYHLKPNNNSRNPWFNEFWERHFNCSLYNEVNGKCSGLKLNFTNSPVDSRVASAMDAVNVFAHALDAILKDKCPEASGVCERMRNMSGREILKYIRNVSFTGMSGNHMHFNENGDVDGQFDILMFTKHGNEYKTVQVGEWDSHRLKVYSQAVSGFREVASSCHPVCKNREVRVPVVGRESCCWTCNLCNGNHYIVNDSICEQCPLGYQPTSDGRSCSKIDIMYFGKNWIISLPATVFAGIGVVSTLFVIGVLIKFDKTPLVKACGRELSHLLLIGILLAFSVTFVTILEPTDVTCIARFFGIGVALTICYASLFIKTNRISRIFNRKNLARRPILILPLSQLVLVVGVVSVQILLLVMLALLRTPRAVFYYPEFSSVYLDCSTSNLDFGLSQVYNFILITMCTIYAFKTRKIPSNFNEAKYIAFAMYSSCVVWLAFLAVYYMEQKYELKPLILCVSVSLIAFVLLCCLYGPKVYIILFRPHRNVRRHVNPSLSLSSLSKEKGQNSKSTHAYVGVNENAENEGQEDIAGSSAEDALDKQRMIMSSDSSKSASEACREENSVPTKKLEMEKLIKHLRRELISTRETLRTTQDQLFRRMQNGRDLRETNLPQGYEKLQANKGEAHSGKTLDNWPKEKTPKVSYEEENNKVNMLHKQKDFKATKKQKFLRGGKPSSSQRRLFACVPPNDVTENKDVEGEAADRNITGSDIGRKTHVMMGSEADREIDQEKWNDREKRCTNERYVDGRCFSDHTPRRSSNTDTLETGRRKSESDIDFKTELLNQHLSEEEDQKEGELETDLLRNKTPCETCQLLVNDEQNNRIICTAF